MTRDAPKITAMKMNLWPRSILMLFLMFGAAGLAVAMRPGTAPAGANSVQLAAIVPEKFGSWVIDDRIQPILPPPDVEEKVSRIYDETLARTYMNERGHRVMLSISYGGDQTGRLRVHRPESCYSAQGFMVKKIGETPLQTSIGDIPVKRLAAQSGARHEPITYWIRIGNSTVTGLLGQRLTQLRFGLTGEVPDGLIFRVSSIGYDNEAEYRLHDSFVQDLMRALPKDHQVVLVGAATARAGEN